MALSNMAGKPDRVNVYDKEAMRNLYDKLKAAYYNTPHGREYIETDGMPSEADFDRLFNQFYDDYMTSLQYHQNVQRYGKEAADKLLQGKSVEMYQPNIENIARYFNNGGLSNTVKTGDFAEGNESLFNYDSDFNSQDNTVNGFDENYYSSMPELQRFYELEHIINGRNSTTAEKEKAYNEMLSLMDKYKGQNFLADRFANDDYRKRLEDTMANVRNPKNRIDENQVLINTTPKGERYSPAKSHVSGFNGDNLYAPKQTIQTQPLNANAYIPQQGALNASMPKVDDTPVFDVQETQDNPVQYKPQQPQAFNTNTNSGINIPQVQLQQPVQTAQPQSNSTTTQETKTPATVATGADAQSNNNKTYENWLKQVTDYKHIEPNTGDYDYRLFYDKDPNAAWDMLNKDSKVHFDDYGKTPAHQTFSEDSYYSGKVDDVYNPNWQVRNDQVTPQGGTEANGSYTSSTSSDGGSNNNTVVSDGMTTAEGSSLTSGTQTNDSSQTTTTYWDPVAAANAGNAGAQNYMDMLGKPTMSNAAQLSNNINALYERFAPQQLQPLRNQSQMSGLMAFNQALADMGKAAGRAIGNDVDGNNGAGRVTVDSDATFQNRLNKSISDKDKLAQAEMNQGREKLAMNLQNLKREADAADRVAREKYQAYKNAENEFKQGNKTVTTKGYQDNTSFTTNESTQHSKVEEKKGTLKDKQLKAAASPKSGSSSTSSGSSSGNGGEISIDNIYYQNKNFVAKTDAAKDSVMNKPGKNLNPDQVRRIYRALSPILADKSVYTVKTDGVDTDYSSNYAGLDKDGNYKVKSDPQDMAKDINNLIALSRVDKTGRLFLKIKKVLDGTNYNTEMLYGGTKS